ncbi:MAG: tRNA-specific adenosine deaminase [Verrucomicrobia bacterium TMED40]|nr:MAG: tRNA-specific adenosine deaminase [Verrucomicrobia bacterium TMED40]|tara:strand:+ start:305 stop:820 length:516 start_codon:yes stop_codon:yes gene_type:complete
MKETPCPFPKVFPSQLVKDDLFFMQMAYNEAINAWNLDEVPIGAVIALDGEVIASACNRTRQSGDPTAHAEMIAITMAAKKIGDWRLNDCQLFVTKEPCPMCSGAVIMSRIGEVHFGFLDSKMGCLGGAQSLHELPKSNHTPVVSHGTFGEECHALVQAFFQLQRQKKDLR